MTDEFEFGQRSTPSNNFSTPKSYRMGSPQKDILFSSIKRRPLHS